MTHNARAIDRARTKAGADRKAAQAALDWAREQIGTCTTDAMRARLLEAVMDKAKPPACEDRGL